MSTTRLATNGNVSVGTASTAVLSADDNRKWAALYNSSDEAIYLGMGAAAVANKGIYLAASGGSYIIDENNRFTGSINAICASGSKNLAYVTSPV